MVRARRKLLVASVGVAAISYVVVGAGCNDMVTSGNLPAPVATTTNPPTSGNLPAPPTVDETDAGDGGDGGDGGDAGDGGQS